MYDINVALLDALVYSRMILLAQPCLRLSAWVMKLKTKTVSCRDPIEPMARNLSVDLNKTDNALITLTLRRVRATNVAVGKQ
jgi:hypothetical protein